MPPLRRLVLALNAATVLLVVAGLLLLAIPAPVPGGDGLSTLVASAGAVPDTAAMVPAADYGASERVVRSNIFSARRSPPARRFMLGDAGEEPAEPTLDSAMAPVSFGESVDSTIASTATDPVPHLYGTMLGPAESTALMRLDARVSEPRLYRVGDRAGGYRVTEIGDRAATLVGPNGRVVLRLPRPDQ